MCYVHKPYKGNAFDGIVDFFNSVPGHSFNEYMQAYGTSHSGWGHPHTIINYSSNTIDHLDQWASPSYVYFDSKNVFYFSM